MTSTILLKTFLLSCYLNYCNSGNYLTNYENSLNDDNVLENLNVIIKHCAEKYSYRQLIMIKKSDKINEKLFKNIYEQLWIPIEVFNDTNEGLINTDWQSCVIFFLSVDEMREFFASPVYKFSWKPSNVYVIYITNTYSKSLDKNEETIVKFAEKIWSKSAVQLWRNNFIYKFILSINGKNLLYDPFERNLKSLKNFNSIKWKINGNLFGVNKNFGKSAELLNNRETFNGYEINVAIFPYVTVIKNNNETLSGVEVNFMKEISQRMNVTPLIFEPPEQFGWNNNGKFYGTLGRLVYRQSDLALNGFFVKNYKSNELVFSGYLGIDEICVILPKRDKVPEYLLIVRIFSPSSLALILSGNGLIVLTYLFITSVDFNHAFLKTVNYKRYESRVKQEKRLRKNYFANFFTPLNSGRKTNLTRVRRFLASWIFFSFYPIRRRQQLLSQRLHVAFGLFFGIIIGGCFTSKLASSLSKPAFLKNINTLEELDKSGLEILTSFPDLINDVFADIESPMFNNLESKLELKNLSEIKRRVFENRNAAYLNRKQTIILSENFHRELHVVEECPKKYHLAYPILRGSPFLPRINTLIGRLQNGGLLTKWFDDMKKLSKNDDSDTPVVIRLPHMYIAFFILLTGLLIALGTFSYELHDSRYSKIPTQQDWSIKKKTWSQKN